MSSSPLQLGFGDPTSTSVYVPHDLFRFLLFALLDDLGFAVTGADGAGQVQASSRYRCRVYPPLLVVIVEVSRARRYRDEKSFAISFCRLL